MGSDSIRGYVLHARGLSWYILQGNPPWGDLLRGDIQRELGKMKTDLKLKQAGF